MERSLSYLVISCNLYYIRIVSYSLAHNSSKFHKPLKDKIFFLFKRYSQIRSNKFIKRTLKLLYYNFESNVKSNIYQK